MFFGSTASPSVTVLSDTQIRAVVPTGTGTVNVTVQSGKNETDTVSDNPNANVTAPIFGYGKSAVTSADQFTFGGAGLAGDANGDGIVNSQDIALVSSNWLTAGPTGDVNFDGIVNSQDIALISSNWLATTGAAAMASAQTSATVVAALAATVNVQSAAAVHFVSPSTGSAAPSSDLITASSFASRAAIGPRLFEAHENTIGSQRLSALESVSHAWRDGVRGAEGDG